MKRKIVAIEAKPDFDPTIKQYFTWIGVTTAYPSIQQVGDMFVVELCDPQPLRIRVLASKENATYLIEDIVKGLKELIAELEKIKV